MEKFTNFSWLILVGIGLIVLEIILGAATGFDLLLIGIIFIISGLLGMVVNSLTITLMMIVILVFFYLFFGRRLIQEKLAIETKSTNVDSLIGKKGIIIKKIGYHKAGQIKVGGEIWRAESDSEVTEGSEAIIKSVSGVTLKVTPPS